MTWIMDTTWPWKTPRTTKNWMHSCFTDLFLETQSGSMISYGMLLKNKGNPSLYTSGTRMLTRFPKIWRMFTMKLGRTKQSCSRWLVSVTWSTSLFTNRTTSCSRLRMIWNWDCRRRRTNLPSWLSAASHPPLKRSENCSYCARSTAPYPGILCSRIVILWMTFLQRGSLILWTYPFLGSICRVWWSLTLCS